MKRMRRGFTLVELLIVVAILGTLAAMMSVSTNTATATAKAQQIINNIEACKTAAGIYYLEHRDDDMTAEGAVKTAAAFLNDTSTYVPGWKDYTTGSIKYTVDTKGEGYEKWAIQVDFTGDAEIVGIKAALGKAKGFQGTTAAAAVTGEDISLSEISIACS